MKRIYIPGSHWAYFKIYSSPKFLDLFLGDFIFSMINGLLTDKSINRFFFVRYGDEIGHHLRLRFYVSDLKKLGSIITTMHENVNGYIEDGIIYKLILDTYDQEIERYGEKSIELCETLFFTNSYFVLKSISINLSYEKMWLSGVKIADDLLSDFGLTIEDKYSLYEDCFKRSLKEFSYYKIPYELKQTFRENRKKIELEIEGVSEINEQWFNYAKEQQVDAVNGILHLKQKNQLQVDFTSLLSSLLHMHYNRVFRSKSRLHELVVYYMMSNFYKSTRIKNSKILKQNDR